jgi:hypothetical protein
MSGEPDKVELCIEALCLQGCNRVFTKIEALKKGQEIRETASLSELERQTVLKELEAIMAVYDGVCDG